MTTGLRPAAFLDRDGVVNVERDYVYRIEDFELLPGVIDALVTLQRAGYALVVVTNQGGIGLGKYQESDLQRLHHHLRAELAGAGVRLDGIYHCPHHPRSERPEMRGPCDCRKPAPGMILQAARDLALDLPNSFLAGDKVGDVAAGRAAGVGQNYLVRSGHRLSVQDMALADGVFHDLADLVHHHIVPRAPA
ncbi:D-glycero-beta-D-manno-heptose 1,7-bisphosphate 7-phosphatase [Ideonella sp. DXS29W]|uniref:D,D-heptose 1,7-bisphosphate phosphatase n=1 Tax=Ideonella lacteola TaxID=2984193 RepID=A0ABU9BND9_9BURK